MTDHQALHLLHNLQKWRRGANIPMPDPKETGKAIDVAIRTLRQKIRTQPKNNII